jgi:hypothetical protein
MPTQVQSGEHSIHIKISALINACKRGHLKKIQQFITEHPEDQQAMLERGDYPAFRKAVLYGHLEVMQYLVTLTPNNQCAMVKSNQYEAFQHAAFGGRMDIMQYLISLAPDYQQAMVESNNYQAFRYAALLGRVDLMAYLISLVPHKQYAVLANNHYHVVRIAAEEGHLELLQYLIALEPMHTEDMLYRTVDNLIWHEFTDLINQALSYPKIFACTEPYCVVDGYGSLIERYTHSALVALREHRDIDEISPEKAQLYFYMIRYLIRVHGSVEDMRLLLNIPAVKQLAPMAVSGRGENELLQLAVELNNTRAQSLLLLIPQVHALAVANNFYRTEPVRQVVVDLTAVARDPESSMRGLNADEQKIFTNALHAYEPTIQELGAGAVVDLLRQHLVRNYLFYPARFVNEAGEEISLPLTWLDFKKLTLTPTEETLAKQAYYQHSIHTVWRYLQKPNPWMHAQAQHVYFHSSHPQQKWSTFEHYLFEIALFYLGAIDTWQPAIDGFTLETRFAHFVQEIALIARAHNWDKTIIKNGHRLECDDLMGDRPSCFSGVKRRLFQSVQGHPLFKIVTLNDIQQLLNSFVHAHFKSVITEQNKVRLAAAWVSVCAGTGGDLSELNISKEKQDAWLVELKGRYNEANLKFEAMIREQLVLDDLSHAERFGGAINLNELLSITALSDEPIEVPAIDELEAKLHENGHWGCALMQEIQTLRAACHSKLSIWQGAQEKCDALIDAVHALPENIDTQTFKVIALNQHSVFYKALHRKPDADRQVVRRFYEALNEPQDELQDEPPAKLSRLN